MPHPMTGRSARAQPRRDALLAAAVEIVAEQGVAGVTHRAVTQRAGVPLATASYYFSSIGELIAEAMRGFGRERAAAMAVPVRAEGEAEPTAAEVGKWFAERVMELPEVQRTAFYELMVNAGRSAELGDTALAALHGYHEAATAGLAALGVTGPEASRQARAFVALGLGYGLLHLVEVEPDDPANLFEALRDLFVGQTMYRENPGEVARMVDGER